MSKLEMKVSGGIFKSHSNVLKKTYIKSTNLEYKAAPKTMVNEQHNDVMKDVFW